MDLPLDPGSGIRPRLLAPFPLSLRPSAFALTRGAAPFVRLCYPSLIQADLVPVITALNIDLDRFVSAARALGLEPLVEVHSEKVMEKLKGHVKLPELAKYEQILKSYVAIRR